jgi:predicted amino acid-binding ACT domain protein
VTGRWFIPVSSINKTDSDYITEILLKVGLNIADVRQTTIQNAVTVESMVWNVLSLALNAERIHVATCLHRLTSEAKTMPSTIEE